MQVTDFLAAVLPESSNGYYCAVELTTIRKEHRFVQTTSEVWSAAMDFNSAGNDTYFALASFAENASRTAANTSALRCFFADIDVGQDKPYVNVTDALAGLYEWRDKTGFPAPILVDSGWGVHAYWPIVESVPSSIWKPLAESFKRSCTAHGFAIDYSVSADVARVLRVPGTFNRKRSVHKLVRIRSAGDGAQEIKHYARLLEPYKEKKATLAVVPNSILDSAPTFAKGATPHTLALSELSRHNFDNIVNMGDAGCGQILHYIRNATQDGIEPLWRGVMSIAKYCVDGEAKCKELADLHPYSDDRFRKKLSDIVGPYNCETLNRTQAGICETCKHWGKIKNPITLGTELEEQKPVAVTVLCGTAKEEQKFPDAPKNYLISERGVGLSFTDADGVPRVSLVADTPFYATATYDRAGERYVQFTYVEHGSAKSAVIPMAIATGKDDAIKAFAKIGIVVPNGMESGFRGYVKATITQAKERPPMLMPTSLGWQADDSFAYNNRLFTRDGEQLVPMYGFDNINETIGVKGTVEGWRLVMSGIMRLERWDMISMMLIGFASPLMKFTGLNGLTFHLCGNDSGKGKTLCQRLASSVWGVPDKFRTTPNTSPLAMVNRLGMLGNLPLLVDEITHKGRADSEWFPEFLSQMSDGRGKDRMESQTNAERRNTTIWSSLCLMTSNKHMMDYLLAERAHGSEGEIRRFIEIPFNRELNLDDLTKSLLYDTLPENYGVAGEAYARWLVRNVDTARAVTKDSYAEVFKFFESSGDERFWIAGCASILAAVRLIGKDHAGIIDIPAGKVARFLRDVVRSMRTETQKMRRSAIDVLNEFTKRNYGKLVAVNDRIARIAGIEVAETLDRRDLCGRVERGLTEGATDYFIEERELRSFCSSISYGYAEFVRDIAKVSAVKHCKKDLLLGTKGPVMAVRCIHIVQLGEPTVDLFATKAANG